MSYIKRLVAHCDRCGLGMSYRPATKNAALVAVNTGLKFYGRNGDGSGWDNDGGYALNYRSL